ncbi:MAG: phosphate ABC transporter permease PstA [Actinobacteria bacterium]|nr:phosphate ABC transporter permease PstA [Actinomycetota bacterium]
MIASAQTGAAATFGRRRLKDRAFTAFLWACGGVALVPLGVIAYYVVRRGLPALSVAFFTKTPAGPLDPSAGGMVQSFIGSGLIVGMACLISIPLGILTAIYLSEYGRGRIADAIRFVAEILLSTPSIVAGLVVSAVVVTAMRSFSAIAGSLAISLLMWPVITRATEEILRLVPQELREGALALGLPRWKVILRIVIPTAGAGILTAMMLAVARGLGETAPILLTALGSDYVNSSPWRPTDAVPLRIYDYARQPLEALQQVAWGGAITLMVGVLVLSIGARVLSARQERRLR